MRISWPASATGWILQQRVAAPILQITKIITVRIGWIVPFSATSLGLSSGMVAKLQFQWVRCQVILVAQVLDIVFNHVMPQHG